MHTCSLDESCVSCAEIFTYVCARVRSRRSFSGCGLLRNGREVTGQNLASTHCFVVFNGACTIRGMVQVASIGRARILPYRNVCSSRTLVRFSYRLFSKVYLPFRRLSHPRSLSLLSPLPPSSPSILRRVSFCEKHA